MKNIIAWYEKYGKQVSIDGFEDDCDRYYYWILQIIIAAIEADIDEDEDVTRDDSWVDDPEMGAKS